MKSSTSPNQVHSKVINTATIQQSRKANNNPSSSTTKSSRNNKDDDDESDIVTVNHPFDLLLEPKYDATTRLYRFLRHMGAPHLAEIADLTGAIPIWTLIFCSVLIIPYIILTTIAKITLPWYLITQQGRFCDVPLDSYLYFRFFFDTIWYLFLIFPLSSTFYHWRILFTIDMGMVLLTSPLILTSVTQDSLCPKPLIALSTTLTSFQLIFYTLALLFIAYRVVFVTKDPYHPGFYPTRDEETGAIMGPTSRSDGRGIIERTFDFLKGNITYLGDKEYGRLGQDERKGKGKKNKGDDDDELDQFDIKTSPTSLDIDTDSDDNDDFGQPETFGFGTGEDDSDLSDLESGVAF